MFYIRSHMIFTWEVVERWQSGTDSQGGKFSKSRELGKTRWTTWSDIPIPKSRQFGLKRNCVSRRPIGSIRLKQIIMIIKFQKIKDFWNVSNRIDSQTWVGIFKYF